MLAANPTLPHPALSASSAHSFAHPRSVGCQLSPVSHPVSPFVATLADSSQPIENPATLSPVFATLTSRVNPKSFVCHSYKKHPGVGIPRQIFPFSYFSILSVNSTVSVPSVLNSHPPICIASTIANSHRIRTYAKCSRNPSRMNTSKTQDLKGLCLHPWHARWFSRKTGE